MEEQEKNRVNEELLYAWLKMCTALNNSRTVTDLPFNESLICSLLYQNGRQPMTATDLCRETRILKSQMNRILDSLEQRGLILRTRSQTDRRQVLIRLNPDKLTPYLVQHEKILQIVDTLLERCGRERADEIRDLFLSLAKIAGEVL